MIRRKLINFPDSSTDYRIGFGTLAELNKYVGTVVGVPRRAVLVCEEALAATHALTVSRMLVDAGFQVSDLALPSAEGAASIAYAGQLLEALDAAGATSDDVVVAVGGAEVCGLVKFCASCWCGGCACVLVPTTLDAMATVACGMRALDTAGSAEMVWTGARAALVAVDLDLVAAASQEERRLGYIELMSSTLMDCRRAWERFGDQLDGIVAAEEVPLVDALNEAQTARLSVVKAPNPGARAAMRYGVATARALRACLGADVPWHRLLAEGMRFEARLGVEAASLTVDDVFLQDDYLYALGIDDLAFDLSPERFLAALTEERERRSNRSLMAIPNAVGSIRLTVVEDELLARHAEAYLASRAELLDADV